MEKLSSVLVLKQFMFYVSAAAVSLGGGSDFINILLWLAVDLLFFPDIHWCNTKLHACIIWLDGVVPVVWLWLCSVNNYDVCPLLMKE